MNRSHSKLKVIIPFLLLFLVACSHTSTDKKSNKASAAKSLSVGQKLQRPTDSEITSAATTQLYYDQYFQPGSVKINTVNGIVTLEGEVDSLRSKERAVRIIELARGVKSVINYINVQKVTKSDQQIKQEAISALHLDPTTDAYNLNLKVKNGVVTMSGKLASYAEKELSKWVVKGISGVREIKDKLDVEWKEKRTDVEISQDIRGRIKKDPLLTAYNINVKTKDGVVVLSGKVGSNAEKAKARYISWVAGVKNIEATELSIDETLKKEMLGKTAYATLSDEEIRSNIIETFYRDPRVSSFSPKVTLSKGFVTLEGTVDNLAAKIAAEQNASNTVGVNAVLNNLEVKPLIQKTDKEIKSNILESFSYNMQQKHYKDIKVNVQKGKVTLSGTIKNPFIKDLATDAAARVNGVKSVADKLSVAQ